MNDPIRLRDASNTFEKALLDAGASEAPDSQSEERLLVAVGLSALGSAAASGVAGAMSASKTAPLGVFSWMSAATVGTTMKAALVVTGITTATSATYLLASDAISESAVHGPAFPPIARRVKEASSATKKTLEDSIFFETGASESTFDDSKTNPSEPIPSNKKSTTLAPKPPSKIRQAEKAPDSSFSEELRLIDTIRIRLAQGDVLGAEQLLLQYHEKFPNGTFAPEASRLQTRIRESLDKRPPSATP